MQNDPYPYWPDIHGDKEGGVPLEKDYVYQLKLACEVCDERIELDVVPLRFETALREAKWWTNGVDCRCPKHFFAPNREPEIVADQDIGPAWEAFKPQVEIVLNQLTSHAAEILPAGYHRRMLIWVRQQIAARLERGGQEYGEDVLFLLGEEGNLMLAVAKAMRLLFMWRAGYDRNDRQDSWLDLGAYAALELARARFDQFVQLHKEDFRERNG